MLNLQQQTTTNKGFVPTSMAVSYNFVQFLGCFYKIVT